jgi:hypothetical protein
MSRTESTIGFICFVALLEFLACGYAVLYGTDGPCESGAWKAAIVLWLVGAAAAGLATGVPAMRLETTRSPPRARYRRLGSARSCCRSRR